MSLLTTRHCANPYCHVCGEPSSSWLPLERATICLNEDHLFLADALRTPGHLRVCPVCGSENIMPLASWLGTAR